MILTAKHFLESSKVSLNHYKKGLDEIKNGTFKYDGSMSNSCVDALYAHKVKVYENVISFLETLPSDCVLSTGTGLTEEGCKYYTLVNK